MAAAASFSARRRVTAGMFFPSIKGVLIVRPEGRTRGARLAESRPLSRTTSNAAASERSAVLSCSLGMAVETHVNPHASRA